MRIIFCTTMFSDVEADLKVSKKPLPVSGHKYQWHILDGLLQNNADVTVINIPRVRHFPDFNKIIVKRSPFLFNGKEIGTNIGFLNLFGLNYITKYYNVAIAIKAAIEKDNDKVMLMTFNTYFPQTFSILNYGEKYGIKTCNVVGDINGAKYGLPNTFTGIKGKLMDLYTELQFKKAQKFDCYVLHTKMMAEALGIENKPYVLMECPLNADRIKTLKFKNSNIKTIFYAGAVREEYGIRHLLNAFSFIKDENYRLVLAGSGPMVNEVVEFCKHDKRVTFLGFVPPSVVVEQQANATALVNPRTSGYAFVKYSFPSKNMESIASGVPFVAHKLECVPGEYDPFIIYPASETDIDLSKALIEACEMDDAERVRRGLLANEFIVKNKNSKTLTKKIIDLFLKIVGE